MIPPSIPFHNSRLIMSSFAQGESSGSSGIVVSISNVETHRGFSSYEILVECEGKQWVVYRRYSQFAELHNSLGIKGVVSFPKKTFSPNPKNEEFLKERKRALQAYIQKVILQPNVAGQEELHSFLGLDSSKTKEAGTEFDWVSRTGGARTFTTPRVGHRRQSSPASSLEKNNSNESFCSLL